MFRADSLEAWLHFLERQHPKGQAGIELGIERVSRVLHAMGLFARLPLTVITVAGTNGKGSSVAMLEAVLVAAGHRVGTYTSPHLLRFNERVRVSGVEASDAVLVRGFAQVEQARGDLPLTYFEYATLAALSVFMDAAVDVAILEVGLGGRLDAVNVVDADGVLLTNVELDHVQWLGPDREAIGREKAGVMRAGQAVVLAESEPPRSVLDHAYALGLEPLCRDRDFGIEVLADGWRWTGAGQNHTLPMPSLAGQHQLDNAAGVVMLLEAMKDRLPWTERDLREGLGRIRLPGRLQRIWHRGVEIWLDVAHNPAGVSSLARALEEALPRGRTHAVFGALGDKDAVGMARQLAEHVQAWYPTGVAGPRGRSGTALAEAMSAASLKIEGVWEHPVSAFNAALEKVGPDDRILVFGSFLCVAEVLAILTASESGA